MPALPTLYSFRRCPYAIRARLGLLQAGIAVHTEEVALRAKPAQMLALSTKGTVPVLCLPDAARAREPGGRVIEQSLEIMLWALRQHDPAGWLQQAPMADMQALIDTNDGPFKQLLDRYKYAERHPQRSREAWRDEAVALMLMPLEWRLQAVHAQTSTPQPHLLSPQASLADMALLPFVRQFAQVDAHWWAHCPLPALREWLQRLCSSALFSAVMAKPGSGTPSSPGQNHEHA